MNIDSRNQVPLHWFMEAWPFDWNWNNSKSLASYSTGRKWNNIYHFQTFPLNRSECITYVQWSFKDINTKTNQDIFQLPFSFSISISEKTSEVIESPLIAILELYYGGLWIIESGSAKLVDKGMNNDPHRRDTKTRNPRRYKAWPFDPTLDDFDKQHVIQGTCSSP